jgi:hypothetical protein
MMAKHGEEGGGEGEEPGSRSWSWIWWKLIRDLECSE